MCSLQLRTVFLMTMTETSAMKLMIRILNFPAKDKWNSSAALNLHQNWNNNYMTLFCECPGFITVPFLKTIDVS